MHCDLNTFKEFLRALVEMGFKRDEKQGGAAEPFHNSREDYLFNLTWGTAYFLCEQEVTRRHTFWSVCPNTTLGLTPDPGIETHRGRKGGTYLLVVAVWQTQG